VVSTAVETCGPVDILVNNAGRTTARPFEQTTEEKWQEDCDLKFWAAVRTVGLVVPHMKTLGRGAIVNITHPGGKTSGPASVPTSVSRAAGIAFTKALSRDLAAHRIRVDTILPDQHQIPPGRARLAHLGRHFELWGMVP